MEGGGCGGQVVGHALLCKLVGSVGRSGQLSLVQRMGLGAGLDQSYLLVLQLEL